MKKFINLTICIILSLLFQCSVLYYLDAVYLKESTKFTVTNDDEPSTTSETNISFDIPSDAYDIQISCSGKYITYFNNNKLMLIDTETSNVKDILSNTKILDVKWVPKDNDTLIILENLSGKVNIKSYNANSGVEQEGHELCDYTKDSELESFICTSAQYVTIKTQETNVIYRFSIDKDLRKVNKNNIILGNCDVFWSKDVFFFEDSINKIFYRHTKDVSTKIDFANPENLVILKCSGNMLYMGEYATSNETKLITKIIYGKDETETSTWETKTLEKPTETKNIYINGNNEILINDDTEKIIKNITTDKNIPYEGNLVTINDKVYSYILDGKIHIKKL